jgi:hypothetical protein
LEDLGIDESVFWLEDVDLDPRTMDACTEFALLADVVFCLIETAGSWATGFQRALEGPFPSM